MVQPVRGDRATAVETAGVPFHTDAVQAFGKVPVSHAATCPCTLLTLSRPQDRRAQGHRRPGRARPQARSRRSSTAAASSTASGPAPRTWPARWPWAAPPPSPAQRAARRQRRVSRRCANASRPAASRRCPRSVVNGAARERAPHVLNVSVPGTDSEALLMHLDLAGDRRVGRLGLLDRLRSSRRTCSWPWACRASSRWAPIRFSFGHESTAEDVDRGRDGVPGARGEGAAARPWCCGRA